MQVFLWHIKYKLNQKAQKNFLNFWFIQNDPILPLSLLHGILSI